MRKTAAMLLFLALLAFSCILTPIPVNAAPRTIVVPDDYLTIGSAIGNATAGDTIFVKKGTYHEQTLTINKTLSLKGENAKDTVITLHPSLIFAGYDWLIPAYTYEKSVRIYANSVEISAFTISAELTTEAPANLANVTIGPTDPPFIASGGAQILSTGNDTKITGNTITIGLSIEGSYQTIAENALASGVGCYGSNNRVVSNLVTGSGIEAAGFSNQIYGNNVVGAYKIPSGIQSSGDANIIAGNNVTNCRTGLAIYRIPNNVSSNNVFYANRVTKNVNGIVVSGGNNNTFFANELVNNSIGAWIDSAPAYWDQSTTNATFHHNNFIGSIQQVSSSTNPAGVFDTGGEGNYWSDYNGLDGDGDGIGDAPYVIDESRRDNYPLMAPYDISKASISDALPENPPEPESIPTVPVLVASVITVVVAGAGLLVHFKKRHREAAQA